jgi:hypothetical protein
MEITLLQKADGPLTKKIQLGDDGQLNSDGSQCLMWYGHARRLPLENGPQDLAYQIHNLDESQAIALGQLSPELPDEVLVVTKRELDEMNGHAPAFWIARTGGHILYKPGVSAWALLDFDTKGMPPAVASRIRQAGGFWKAILAVVPGLAGVARVTRASTSSCIINTDTGAKMPGSDGIHVYVHVQDGGDVKRFLETLHDRCWLAGSGWMMAGKAGQLLERSIVDRLVYAPERLVFEAPPQVIPPLKQDHDKRAPVVTEGDAADTVAICRDLSAVEQARLQELKQADAVRVKPDAAKARAAFVAEQADKIVARTGISQTAARQVVEKQCGGILLPHVVLPFDAGEFRNCTVADVLADPDRFIGATLADPLEGIEYGRCKAKIMRRGDGSIWINSFAHGRTTYDLRYDKSAIEAALRAADKADVRDTLVRLIVLADLTQSDEQDLKALASELCGAKARPLSQQIKEAREKQRKQRAAEERQKRAATRTDKRIQLPVPHPDAERTPVLKTLDEVLTAVEGPQPPMRNIEGWPVEIRCRPPSKLHELTSSGANQNEEETSRLPPPSLPLITAHDRFSLAHEIERHIEFGTEDKDGDTRPVALPGCFVDHYLHWRDSALPRVEAVVTAPLVLADGTLLAPDGLDRERRLFFRIEPELRELLPTHVTKEDVADATDFLCNGWLCDVATDFVGKCVLIACALSILERVLLPERPAFFVTAGKRGGGKTTVITMICLAITGKKPAAAAWSANEEERRKAMLGYLSEGLPCLVWDNLPLGASVSCPTLDKVLTAESYSDRVLQQSVTRTVPAFTIQMFTGNNILPRGDTSSRSLRTRLEVNQPDPENRQFTHADPMAWTLAHRGEILKALYIILLGNPQLQPGQAKERKTRFKTWWHLVGSAVETASAALVEAESYKTPDKKTAATIDFGKVFADVEADDEESGGISRILEILNRTWPTLSFQASDIAKFIGSGDARTEEDRKALCEFFDPSGRRGTEIPTITIGMRLKTILDAPVYADDQTMTLIAPREGGGTAKKATFFKVRVAPRTG